MGEAVRERASVMYSVVGERLAEQLACSDDEEANPNLPG